MTTIADPRVDLRLLHGSGAPTAANIASSGADVVITAAAEHVLCLLSGGEREYSWRELEVAMATAAYFDKSALSSVLVARSAVSLRAMAGIFRAALSAGLSTESRGNLKAALHYFVSFVRSARSSSPQAFTFDDPSEFTALAPYPQSFVVPQGVQWITALNISMCVDEDGDALALGVILDILVHRYSPAGRSSATFIECADELFQVACEKQPNLLSKSINRQAIAVASTVSSNGVTGARILVCHPAAAACAVACDLRKEGSAALRPRFLEVWTIPAFQNIRTLLTERCAGREAWSFATRLINKEPTCELLEALDSRVGRLLGTIETNAELSAEDADISARVSEMERLLNTLASSRSTGSASEGFETSGNNPLGLSKLFAQPSVKEFMDDMSPLLTTPLVPYRIVKHMLPHKCCMGWQFLAGKTINHSFFHAVESAKKSTAVQMAFQRHMCTDADQMIRAEWFPYLLNHQNECPVPFMMIKGTMAEKGKMNLNLWLQIASPRIKMLEGPHACNPTLDATALNNPHSFFSNELMLREGAEHVVHSFAFIGYGGDEEGSLYAALETLKGWAHKIFKLPDSLVTSKGERLSLMETKSAACGMLERAGVAAFQDMSENIATMIATSPQRASRPPAFAPENCRMASILAELEENMTTIYAEMKLRWSIDSSLQSANAPTFNSPAANPPPFAPPHSGFPTPPAIQSPFFMPPSPGRGALAHTLQIEGAGFWLSGPHASPATRIWCGAKHSGAVPFRLQTTRTCMAALLPLRVPKEPYCTGRLGCEHQLPGGYTPVFSDRVLSPEELLTTKRGRQPGGWERGANKARGRGRGRAGGRGINKGGNYHGAYYHGAAAEGAGNPAQGRGGADRGGKGRGKGRGKGAGRGKGKGKGGR